MMCLAIGVIYLISRGGGGDPQWDARVWVVVLFLLLDVQRDRREEVPWRKFLPWGIAALLIPYIIYRQAPTLWWSIARFQFGSVHAIFDLNGFMKAIPGNSASFIWQHRIPFFGPWIGWSYGWGFGLVIWAAAIRSFFVRDVRKMVQYVLATHVLQTPLIVPFFWLINVREVWFVLGHPDMLGRTWPNANAMLVEVMNCFPSMHTSIAFAVLLLALREKGRLFKWGMVAFSASIIYSTMYMEVHWVLDVLAGMAFAYGVVKLSDWILAKLWAQNVRIA